MDIKDILECESSSEKVASSSVDDTLRFSGGSRSLRKWRCHVRGSNGGSPSNSHVKDEQRILSRHNLRRTVVWDLEGLFMPPLVTSLRPGNGVSGPPLDKNVLDLGATFESGIDDGLGSNGLSTSSALVGGDQNAGLAILDAVTKRLGGETGEDDGVDGTDTSASQESGNSVPGHRHVDGDGVTLLDSHRLEDVGYTANFAEKLSIGDFAAFARLIGFVDDCGLVRGRVL